MTEQITQIELDRPREQVCTYKECEEEATIFNAVQGEAGRTPAVVSYCDWHHSQYAEPSDLHTKIGTVVTTESEFERTETEVAEE